MSGRGELGAVAHGGVGAQVDQPGELERVAASGVGLGQQPVRARGLQAVLAVAALTEVLPTISQRVTAASRVAPHLLHLISCSQLPLSCENSVESFPQVRRPQENTLIAVRAKRAETRSWRPTIATPWPLAVHAAQGFPGWARAGCQREPFRSVLTGAGYPSADTLPRGAVVAVAQVLAIRPTSGAPDLIEPRPDLDGWTPAPNERSFGDYTPGRFAWLLGQVTPLPTPIGARGALGLWTWTPPTWFPDQNGAA